MALRRKNSNTNTSGVRINGKIFHEGRCIGKLTNARIEDFEDQVRTLKKKFS